MNTTLSNEQTKGFPAHNLTAFQRDALAAIAGSTRPCGQDVKRDLEAAYETGIHHGRLYPNLDTLVEKGLVAKGQVDRRTNAYELTARGKRVLEADAAWRRTRIDEGDET